ncbi:hypothetical protein VTK73DRAFT_3333 [Phialemonium thermophilum]|uniref:Transmembrane protein n=1 Tax=Phialemonium thermophilum TaxID=223376 RepID=A0ABR3VJT0_9PEZI
MPRRASVAGRAASLHSVGMAWAKGLKFFSAATSCAAAASTSGSLPRAVTIWSARASCAPLSFSFFCFLLSFFLSFFLSFSFFLFLFFFSPFFSLSPSQPAYLGTGVGSRQQDTRGLACQGGGLTGVAKGGQALDGVLHEALLAEAGLGQGREGGDKERLGLHGGKKGKPAER